MWKSMLAIIIFFKNFLEFNKLLSSTFWGFTDDSEQHATSLLHFSERIGLSLSAADADLAALVYTETMTEDKSDECIKQLLQQR